MRIPILPPKRDNDDIANLANAVEAINCVFDQLEDGSYSLGRRGGLWSFWHIPEITSGVDGLYWWENKKKLIAVIGGRIFVFSSPSMSPIEISTSTIRLQLDIPVQFETNGEWLFMANGGYIVKWNGVSATAEIETAQPFADYLAYLNGCIIANEKNSNRVRYTEPEIPNVNQPPVWSSGFFTPEANPDKLQAVTAKWGELLLWGTRSVEIWYYSGNSPVPFNRVEGAYIERGVLSPYSIIAFDNSWFWFDHERKLTRLTGRSLEIISIPFDQAFKNIREIYKATAFIIDQRFYVLTFPYSDYTFVFDLYTKSWGKWSYFNETTGQHERFLGQCACYSPEWDLQFVGSRKEGRVFVYHPNLVTDFFNPIRLEYYTAHLDHGTLELKQANKLMVRLRRGA